MSQRKPWSRAELILAFNLYLKISFGQFHQRNIHIIELANLIGRTPSAVSMRLSNFAAVDPFHKNRGVVGLRNGINQVNPIWNEFHGNKEELIFESEKVLAEIQQTTIENKYKKVLEGTERLEGKSKLREVKTRINQNVFREIVLANYKSRCAITGLGKPDFLIASHIIPWANRIETRLDPSNGLCLSYIYEHHLFQMCL